MEPPLAYKSVMPATKQEVEKVAGMTYRHAPHMNPRRHLNRIFPEVGLVNDKKLWRSTQNTYGVPFEQAKLECEYKSR